VLLTLICLPIARGSRQDLGRPGIKPFEVKERLMRHVQQQDRHAAT
jgi:hypothetical protein